MQNDGNFVVYPKKASGIGPAIWATTNYTAWNKTGTTPPYSLVMQDDGNLVIYDSTMKVV
jgi:hypothetical protein